MSETQTVRLPNGEVIHNVPIGTPKSVIQDKAISSGLATLADFETPTAGEEESGGVSGFLKENMEIPLGLGGALGGAAAGFVVGGPAGALVGGILGGSAGSGAGSLASDALAGEDLNYHDAVEEAIISAGFDIATLGLGKVIKPAWVIGKKALGFSPQEVADEIIKNSAKGGFGAGTKESLQASQAILQQRGASLTRYQTGKASALEVFAEKIGEAGLVSGKESSENMVRVNVAAQGALDDIFGAIDVRTGASPAELGSAVYDIITAGRVALSQVYGDGLEELSQGLSKKAVNTKGISKKLNFFLRSNTEKTTGLRPVKGKDGKMSEKMVSKNISTLDPATRKFINSQLQGALELGNMSAQSLLKIDKMITQQMKQFGDIKSSNYNAVADRELGELQHILKQSFIDTLKQVDPKVASRYKELKTVYKEGMEGLLPVINKSTIKNADDGNYDALGKLLTTQDNVSKISAMFKSIDESYAQLAKIKGLPSDIPYATAKEAKHAIKNSFIKNLLPKANTTGFDIKDYAELATRFSTPTQNRRMRVILGEDYNSVKQLFNLFSEASKKPEGNLGTLFLRAKEYAAIGAVGGTVAGGPVVGILTAATILTAPVFLAKMSANPRAVNKLLAFEKATFKTEILQDKALSFIISDVMDALSEEEQAEVRNSIRGM